MDSLPELVEQMQAAMVVAGLAILLLWESAQPFFHHFRDARRMRVRHGLRNLLLGALNAALIALVFAGLWTLAATWAAAHGLGLFHALDARWDVPVAARLLGVVLLLDGWTYLWHRINHVVPLFWRFHRVHHSDPHMDVTTASRFHVGEIVFSSLLRIPVILLVGAHAWEVLLYEVLMFAVVQFHHADVALPERIDRRLRVLIVTPAMHRVHHSRWQPETDSNYSALFSFWDRLGRSFRLRANPSDIRLGLDEFDAPEDQTISGLLKTPTRNQRVT